MFSISCDIEHHQCDKPTNCKKNWQILIKTQKCEINNKKMPFTSYCKAMFFACFFIKKLKAERVSIEVDIRNVFSQLRLDPLEYPSPYFIRRIFDALKLDNRVANFGDPITTRNVPSVAYTLRTKEFT